MKLVTEHLHRFPFDRPATVLTRNEQHLLTPALPGPFGAYGADTPRIDVLHFDVGYSAAGFAAPRVLYESSSARIEWQQMDNRQPIYHRNLDVDEMSYQISGERTLMSEHGTVELEAGDFVRLPVGVCHDNWGRQESHLLWYVHAPCTEEIDPVRRAEVRIPPFDGWECAIVNEVTTDRLGAPGDTAAQRSDERLLLEHATTHDERLVVVHPQPRTQSAAAEGPPQPQWIWKSATTWIGFVDSAPTDGTVYTRHTNADEIQYQVAGRRLLVTQLGVVPIGPGDLVRIPVGIAFTSISDAAQQYIATVSTEPLRRVLAASRDSEDWAPEQVAAHRDELFAPDNDAPQHTAADQNHGGTK